MRIAYLDCFSGISGDMFLGALLDAGVSPEFFKETVESLNIGARLEVSRVNRSGISATKVDVYSHGEKDMPRDEYFRSGGHEHRHEHAHEHGHTPSHGQEHGHSPAQAHGHGRGLKEIREVIRRANGISEPAKRTAIAIFENLGAAEAKIHDVPVEKVHFHEVGAVDAMVDIVCSAAGAEALKIDEWVCSPLNVGSGTVVCAHGTFPIPAPATVELLKNAPVYSSGPQVELVTPTGAAIVKTLARRFATFPSMKITNTGYGAGTRDFPGYANVLRLTIGDAVAETGITMHESISVLEASIDDMNPQVFGYVLERALAEGALEAFGAPLQMKKNRPGMLLTVLARQEDSERLARLIFSETTTLGVRVRHEERQTLARRWVSVHTRWGDVRMKLASLNGTITNFAPEYEDCRRIASEQHVPLKTVMQETLRVYLGEKEHEQHG